VTSSLAECKTAGPIGQADCHSRRSASGYLRARRCITNLTFRHRSDCEAPHSLQLCRNVCAQALINACALLTAASMLSRRIVAARPLARSLVPVAAARLQFQQRRLASDKPTEVVENDPDMVSLKNLRILYLGS
jgi:hypothetical protein